MRVVLAPNAFKGSLTAAGVAAALAEGIRAARPDVEIEQLPVADGGDGTVDAAVAAGYARVPVTASGPTELPVRTSWARQGNRAVVELACVCGLTLLPGGPDPMGATSRGLGEVLAAAVDSGATDIVVGIGGSASTDGGKGMLGALASTALTGVRLTVASDVSNPLLGPTGAAAVYAPQKGATPQQVAELEARLTAWAAEIDPELAGHPGAGAAGGVGFALLHLGATLRPGVDVVLELVGFDARLYGADLVVTGEGALDAQTLHGKAPAGVAARAGKHGVPVVAVAGSSTLSAAQAAALGFAAVHPLTDLAANHAESMRDAYPLVVQLGERIAKAHLP